VRNEPQQSEGYEANIVGIRSLPQPTANTLTISIRTLLAAEYRIYWVGK